MRELLSTGEAMRELGISRMTLYQWMKADPPKIRATIARAGKRTFFTFEKGEVKRVKALLKPKREKGKSLLRVPRS